MKYRVHGICFVPAEAAGIVEAATPGEAVAIAKAAFRKNPREFLIGNSEDDGAAHSWEPTAEAAE